MVQLEHWKAHPAAGPNNPPGTHCDAIRTPVLRAPGCKVLLLPAAPSLSWTTRTWEGAGCRACPSCSPLLRDTARAGGTTSVWGASMLGWFTGCSVGGIQLPPLRSWGSHTGTRQGPKGVAEGCPVPCAPFLLHHVLSFNPSDRRSFTPRAVTSPEDEVGKCFLRPW